MNKTIIDTRDNTAELILRARAAYVGLAVGDALGATVEFMTPREIKHKYGIHRDIIGGGWLHLARGEITDDTEMSLVLGRCILHNGEIKAEAIAQAFSDWMRGKPKDIGNTVRRGIMHFRNTGAAEMSASDMDAGNGSCMRTLPLALFMLGAENDAIVNASRLQAHITHNSQLADAGTECVIDIVQLALGNETKVAVEKRINNLVTMFPEFRFRNKNISNPSGYIVETLQVVFDAFLGTSGFESCLVDVVNRGGDADTTGAIAGMIAGAFYGMDEIPKNWLKALNRSILNECMQQAELLVQVAPHIK